MNPHHPDPPAGEEWVLGARWIFPVEEPPLSGGTVTLRDDRIVAVHPHGVRKPDLDLGNVALLPGLVNAHTHLDLSDARGKIPPGPDFPDWLRRVGQHRRGQSAEELKQAIEDGIRECLRFGVTLLGDISVRGATWDHLVNAPLRSVVFHEMIGLTEKRAKLEMALTEDWLRTHAATSTCRPAYSLHAPYSVHKSVFQRRGQDCCLGLNFPIAIHVAESLAEQELLHSRSGPFVNFLQEMGVWGPDGLVQDVGEILRQGTPRSLFIHGNTLTPERHPILGTLVYCPRTHAAFGHALHPFRAYLAQGTRVILATDSLASNPDLDVLAEARFVHQRYPDVPGETLLRMITLDAAAALGWDDQAGSLTVGKSADLVVLPLPEREAQGPFALIFQSPSPVQETLFRGRWRRSIK